MKKRHIFLIIFALLTVRFSIGVITGDYGVKFISEIKVKHDLKKKYGQEFETKSFHPYYSGSYSGLFCPKGEPDKVFISRVSYGLFDEVWDEYLPILMRPVIEQKLTGLVRQVYSEEFSIKAVSGGYFESTLDKRMLHDFDYFIKKDPNIYISAMILISCANDINEEEEAKKYEDLYELMKNAGIDFSDIDFIYARDAFFDLVKNEHGYDMQDRNIYFENIDRYYNMGGFSIDENVYSLYGFVGKDRNYGGIK